MQARDKYGRFISSAEYEVIDEFGKPCPFCGAVGHIPAYGGPLSVGVDTATLKRWAVECLSCGASGPSASSYDEAVEKWKGRT